MASVGPFEARWSKEASASSRLNALLTAVIDRLRTGPSAGLEEFADRHDLDAGRGRDDGGVRRPRP